MNRLFAVAILLPSLIFCSSVLRADDGGRESSIRNAYNVIYCWFNSCETEQDLQARDDYWTQVVEPRLVGSRNSSEPSGNGGHHAVPELDGSVAPIAIALVAGLVGLGLERRRRRSRAKA